MEQPWEIFSTFMSVTSASLESFRRSIQKIISEGSAWPRWQVVLGSGFGQALSALPTDLFSAWCFEGQFHFSDIAGLASSTVSDHLGEFHLYRHRLTREAVLFQLGRIHGYEGLSPCQVVMPVLLGRLSGIPYFLLTNAAGALDPSYCAGDAMVIRDHVNFTGQNPLIGKNPVDDLGRERGPRFPDMSDAYHPAWRKTLMESLKSTGSQVHEGTYLGVMGPSFETPSEVALFAQWGLQAVGMSTVWETIALKHSGAQVAGLSLISNPAAGIQKGLVLDHLKIVETCRVSANRMIRGVFHWLELEFLRLSTK